MSLRPGKVVCLFLGLLAALTVAPAPQTMAAGEPYSEEAVKAAFLYRFAGYVEWPDSTPKSGPFQIAVLGDDAVAHKLELLLPDRAIKGRAAQVRRIDSIDGLGTAQILYIGPSQRKDLGRILAKLAGRPILIVTDHERGLDLGSTVNFRLVDRRVRFEVSLPAAERCGLNVSSDLLSVAMRVRGKRLRSEADSAPQRWAGVR